MSEGAAEQGKPTKPSDLGASQLPPMCGGIRGAPRIVATAESGAWMTREADMRATRLGLIVALIVAGLFILAGLRNMFAPGLLSVRPGHHGSGVTELLAGVVILALALVGWARGSRAAVR